MKTKKLKHSLANSLWQMLPMLSTLIMSLVFVKLFSVAFWGAIISVLVVQQIVNGIAVWGNKDFLQRELANNHLTFKSKFSQLILERFALLVGVVFLIYILNFVDSQYLLSFLLIVCFRFICQSFDVLVIKEQKFMLMFGFDFLILIIQLFMIFFFKNKDDFSINMALMIFWLPLLIKSLFLFALFRMEFGRISLNKILIFESVFFGLITISALIHSKIDLLIISKLLDHKTIGEYQIIIAFLWSIQSISMFISTPFVHRFYRLNKQAQANSSKLLKNIGLIIVPIAVVITMFILNNIFKIPINFSITVASLIFSISSFIYLPWVFQINQNKHEYLMLIINIVGTIVLFVMLLLFNSFWKLKIETIIWIITIQQILISISVYLANKKSIREK